MPLKTLKKANRPIIALAPMAGVSDLPFRTLCENLGADYSVTEMAASAPQLLSSQKNQSRLTFPENTPIKILQIIGNNPTQMANAAKYYAENGAEIIDINLGCPAKKVNKKGAGSALLSDLPLVTDILRAVTASCTVPVTVKTRLGPDHHNYTLFDIAEILPQFGIETLTVHGRTRADKFNGQAQFNEIARIKDAFPNITVIANGDISNLEDAQKVLVQTQCDGIMIGRGAVGNPWLFTELRKHFDDSFSAPIIDKPSIIMAHIRAIHNYYGNEKGLRLARKHIQKYLSHLRYHDFFVKLVTITDADIQLATLSEVLTHNYV